MERRRIDGIGFDGSSIRGFQHIHESDMLLMPDPTTAYVDPTLDIPTLILSCDVVEPGSREPYSRDPRYVARKAERYLAESGIATTSFWGPEVEFYIFDSLRFETAGHKSMYEIDSDEGIWNSSRNGTPNLAHRPRPKEGYFPVPPLVQLGPDAVTMLGDALRSDAARGRGLFRDDHVSHLLEHPQELTALKYNQLWELGVLELCLQTHGIG